MKIISQKISGLVASMTIINSKEGAFRPIGSFFVARLGYA
jgi:hypothetical protein